MPNLIIPPRDLPPATEVFPSDALVVDNGASVSKATPVQVVDAGRPWATIQEAQDGTASGVSMSPLTTAAAIQSRVSDAVNNAAAGVRPYPTYAAVLAAAPQAPADSVSISGVVSGREVTWIRDDNGTCLGGGWSPAGNAGFRHWGGFGTGIADDAAAIQAAYMSGFPLYDDGGVWRQVGGVTARHPLTFKGTAGKTVLRFEGMGGFNGQNGITLQATGAPKGAKTSMSGATVRIIGANGASFIATPRGAAVFNDLLPTYDFSDFIFEGQTEILPGLYDTAWARGFDIGDSDQAKVSKIKWGGNYQHYSAPTGDAIRNTAIYLSGVAGEGGVSWPLISDVLVRYAGNVVEIGHQVVRPKLSKVSGHRCWNGFWSPNGRPTAAQYGVTEASFVGCDFNVQNCGIRAEAAAGIVITDVDVTRARGGFNHGQEVRGFDIRTTTRVSLVQTRYFNDGVLGEFTGDQVGYHLEDCPNATIVEPYLRSSGLIQDAIRIVNPTKASVVAANLQGPVTNGVVLAGAPANGANVTLAGVTGDTGLVNRIAYRGTVTRRWVNDLDEISGVNSAATNVSAAGTETMTMGVSPKWRRISFAAGAGAYNYDITMSGTGAREGDTVDFTFAFPAANGTVRIYDTAGTLVYQKTGTAAATYNVKGEYLNTNPSQFRIVSSGQNT